MILSVVDGLYPTDPGTGQIGGEPIPLVVNLDEETFGRAGTSRSSLALARMRSKLEAACAW